jgi:pSer/pThr/pTyr-binding forkhead associated (FHA) protein
VFGPPTEPRPRVRVHPGAGVVDRRGDTVLVVPALPMSTAERVRELLELCRRPDPTGQARLPALRALLDPGSAAELPGFALLVRSGRTVRVLVHGPVRVLVDGRAAGQPATEGGRRLTEHVLADGAWDTVTVAADEDAGLPDAGDVLSLDLESGSVPGAGITLHRAPARREQPPPAAGAATTDVGPGVTRSATMLRPAVQFRSVLLGECAVRAPAGQPPPARRPPLPVAGAPGGPGAGTRGPEVLVEAVRCPRGHITDPDQPTCLACGAPLPPDGRRVSLPRPPLGIIVTDGGTIYTVTGDVVIGREPEQAPDVLAGRARPLPLRDAARSTSRVHARLVVRGWQVLLSDAGSANGTFVSRSGAAGPWLPATPDAPVPLVHGDRVRLGQRQLLFDTWREAVLPQVFQ